MTKPAGADWRVTLGSLAGVAAPLVYGFGVIVGGVVTPGYSHIGNMISELTMVGVRARFPLAAIFVSYNLLLVCFARVVPRAIPEARHRGVRLGSYLLVVIAIAGVGMSVFFPTDRPADPLTAIGWGHVGFAAIASLGTMAAVFSFAWALRSVPSWRALSTFSFGSLAMIAASGIWTAMTTAQLSPLMGLRNGSPSAPSWCGCLSLPWRSCAAV